MPAGILRLIANNPGPMTFAGTNSYVFGNDEGCCILDPGPAGDDAHLEALTYAVRARKVEAIFLTHRHADHSGLLVEAARRFDAPFFASADDRIGSVVRAPDGLPKPDRVLSDGDELELAGGRIEIVGTPGHTSDHIAFALREPGILFSGDHVMGWSTTVVIPPDGSMRAYRDSLRKCLERPEMVYLPGHGEPVERPERLVRKLLAHRQKREEMILGLMRERKRDVADLVAALYPRLDVGLKRAAEASVRAHLVELMDRGELSGPSPCEANGPFSLREHPTSV